MIVKFHARGRGGGAGPVDYLLGKERNRPGAVVLQGKAEEVRELIDASPYAKKYTSGVLSFAEAGLPCGEREKVMASFERVLMPGLDKDQYSVLWVEHTDKGRLELNFLIPNTELLTGKRLQPYFDRADRPRIDAWQTVVNGRLGLQDPKDPARRRSLVTDRDLPADRQEAAAAITAGVMRLCAGGEVRTRDDVIQALQASGFDVVRTTPKSISIASPEGGRNIRLKGAPYEQSFNAGEGLRAEIEGAAAAYRADTENRVQRAREVCKRGTERKREANRVRHPRPRAEHGRGHEPEPSEHHHAFHENVAERGDDHAVPGGDVRCRAVVAGEPDRGQRPGDNPAAGRTAADERENVGRELPGGTGRAIPGASGGDGSRHELDDGRRETARGETGAGVKHDDRAGNTVAERLRAVTAGLLAKAGELGERLRGLSEYVSDLAGGKRSAERARAALEQSGDGFERAAAPFVRHLNHEEHRLNQEREQKTLELQRSQRQKTYDGPTLG